MKSTDHRAGLEKTLRNVFAAIARNPGTGGTSDHFLSRRPSLNELTSTHHKGPFGATPRTRHILARVEVLS